MRIYYRTVVVLMILITTSMASFGATPAGKIDTIYTGGDEQAENGQNINVTISTTGMNSIGIVTVGVSFNNTVLYANSITDGDLKKPGDISGYNIFNDMGILTAGVARINGINGSGTLFTINFKVIGDAGSTSGLLLTLDANDTTSTPIDISKTKITNGTFRVSISTTAIPTIKVTSTPAPNLTVTAVPTTNVTPTMTATPSPITPLLGVFYYPLTGGSSEEWRFWKDDNHTPPTTWYSNYIPDYTPGFDPANDLYSAKNTTIIKKQLELMKQAGIDFVISSWWYQDDYEDQVLNIIFNQVLNTANNTYPNIKFAASYDREGGEDTPQADIISDINYLKNKYMNSPYYLKIDGKPVLFVDNYFSNDLPNAQKWSNIKNDTGLYIVLRTFTDYQNNMHIADNWYDYDPSIAFKQEGNYSAFISPGYHINHESPSLAREDFVRFENNVKSLKDADVQFKLIQTWNDWSAGSQIEPGQRINHDDINGFSEMPSYPSYGTKYIEILNKYFSTVPMPTPTTAPTTTPTTAPTTKQTPAETNTPIPTSPPSSGGGGSSSGSSSSSGGGGGGGASISPEPFSNILRYESQDRELSTVPVPFAFKDKELGIYEVMIATTQSIGASLRIELLKDTSKLVNTPAPGIVYKNVNAWLDYSRIKSIAIRFNVENSWIDKNGISADNIKIHRWDNGSKKWIELSTITTKKDDNYTSFDSQTDNISTSFAISGTKKNTSNTVSSTPVTDANVVQQKTSGFDIGVFVPPTSFASENHVDILNKLKNNNISRIIVPVYDAKKGDKIHIFYTEAKGLDISATESYSLNDLLTEAHNRKMEVYAQIASFGPDPVQPTEDQKQNLKKIINHILNNYVDDKGNKVDGIYLDYISYEDPLSANGDTDTMANLVKDLNNEIKDRSKLSASVKSANYESLFHLYFWPYLWPLSGPSDYYHIVQDEGQDYARLSRSLDVISPIMNSEDSSYVAKATKFVKDKVGNDTTIIPNIQMNGKTKDSEVQYLFESAKNNGANGVNILDYSTVSESEWNIIKNMK